MSKDPFFNIVFGERISEQQGHEKLEHRFPMYGKQVWWELPALILWDTFCVCVKWMFKSKNVLDYQYRSTETDKKKHKGWEGSRFA